MKDIASAMLGQDNLKSIATRYGYSLGSIKSYREEIKEYLRLAEYSADRENRTKAKEFVDELFESSRRLMKAAEAGPIARDDKGMPLLDPTQPDVPTPLRNDPDIKAWSSALGAATNLARLAAEIDGDIGPKAAAKELAQNGGMGVQLCLVLPGPEDTPLIEGDVVDVEVGDVDYGEIDGNHNGSDDDRDDGDVASTD